MSCAAAPPAAFTPTYAPLQWLFGIPRKGHRESGADPVRLTTPAREEAGRESVLAREGWKDLGAAELDRVFSRLK